MRTNNLIIVILFCLFASTIDTFAKTVNYKGVSITRGDKNPEDIGPYDAGDWTTDCVYICNYNRFPVKVKYKYKLDSRDAPWQETITFELSAYEEGYWDGASTDVPSGMKDYQLHTCYSGEIKAIQIVYVDILKPSPINEALNVFFNNVDTQLGN